MGSSLTGSVFNLAKTQEVINNESFEIVGWSPLFCGIHYTPVVISNAGEIAIGCEPDNSGRQVVLRPALYPTDVLNILMETGGFILANASTNLNGSIVWNLTK